MPTLPRPRCAVPDCNQPSARASTLCRAHDLQRRGPRYDRAWTQLAAATVAAWRAIHGDVCPGWHRPPHPSTDLTADHIVPLIAGGPRLDPTNIGVLCRGCNTRKGTSAR